MKLKERISLYFNTNFSFYVLNYMYDTILFIYIYISLTLSDDNNSNCNDGYSNY